MYILFTDLKLNDLDIVEKYRKRSALLNRMAQNKCHRCPKLQEHYVVVKNQHLLQERVKQLKFELSDAALQQMPDFQQRVCLIPLISLYYRQLTTCFSSLSVVPCVANVHE